VAPLAVSPTDCPLQMLAVLGVMLTVGVVFTVTDTVAVELQLPVVPVTVYVIFVVGLAVGLDELGLARLVVGVHEYEVAPLACNCTELPEQITGVAGVMEMFGLLFTVTVTDAVPVHVPVVPVTV
jgi:hypothetical protein